MLIISVLSLMEEYSMFFLYKVDKIELSEGGGNDEPKNTSCTKSS